MVFMGCSNRWQEVLSDAQKRVNTETKIDIYATYEISDIKGLEGFDSFSLLDTLFPGLRYIQSDGYKTDLFNITKESAYKFLKTIAQITNTTDKLVLHKPGKTILKEKENTSSEDLSSYWNVVDDLLHGKRRASLSESEAEESKPDKVEEQPKAKTSSSADKKNKNKIIAFLRDNGFPLVGQTITKAHVIVKNNYYWANPLMSVVDHDWSLILDDQINKIFYIFEVPEHSMSVDQFKIRNDVPKLEIEIEWNNRDFLELCRGIKFADYKVGEISYKGFEQTFVDEDTDVEEAGVDNKEFIFARDNSLTTLPLSKIPSGFANHTLYSYEFDGESHRAHFWKIPLDTVMNYLYKKYPEEIEKLAEGPFYHSDKARCPFISKHRDDIIERDLPHKIAGTEIYYKTGYDVDAIIQIMQMMLRRFGENLDILTLTFK